MAKYKLVKRGKPGDINGPKKWYATPISEKAQSSTATTRAATQNTSTAPTEMEGACYLLRKYCEQQLLQGHIATIPYFGTLRVSFRSVGVDDISSYNAGTMIKNPRIVFTTSKEFRDAVINNLTFENAGVIAEGITYGSVSNYLTATGANTGDSGNTDTGDSGNTDTGGDSGGSSEEYPME